MGVPYRIWGPHRNVGVPVGVLEPHMGFWGPLGYGAVLYGFGVPIGLRGGPRCGCGVFRVPIECGGVPYGIWDPYRNGGVPDAGVGFSGSP